MQNLDDFDKYLSDLVQSIKEKYPNPIEFTESEINNMEKMIDDLEQKINNLKLE